MRILLLGKAGQVGGELQRALAPLGEIRALDRHELDLSDLDAVRRTVRAAAPEVLVNAAAYTAVEKAETEPELAFRVNAEAPGALAEECERLGALLVHYSTDYVFDGSKTEPYVEKDLTHPLNVYGASKLEGERRVVECASRYLIFRTAWVYGPRGSNFLLRILELAATRPELRIVSDQFGAPTTSAAIADGTRSVLEQLRSSASGIWQDARSGIYHMTTGGRTNWCEFATEALRARSVSVAVTPIPASEYQGRAKRPQNSLLSNEKIARVFNIRLPDWREALASCLRVLPAPQVK